ncbi:MAG: GAF domain-containing protein [Anaerolineae bacterium]|nr:GAF domain-containing protein [Anaerolineae bacterium]MCB9103938.1 GAF domain-containing protein [Anaerolineales bacterium]
MLTSRSIPINEELQPAMIQNYGFMVVCSLPDLGIVHVSENIKDQTGKETAVLLNKPLSILLDPLTLTHLKETLNLTRFGFVQSDAGSEQPPQMPPDGEPDDTGVSNEERLSLVDAAQLWFEPTINGRNFYLSAQIIAQELILEFEPIRQGLTTAQFSHLLDRLSANIRQAKTLEALLQSTARQLRQITDFDRIMVYRFDAMWNAEVVAEAKRDDLSSYLGLRYPATGFPPKTRTFYHKYWTRMTVDVETEPVRLIPTVNPITLRLPDLSGSNLKAASEVQIKHLRTIGVKASLVIAITHNTKLWGLLVCHHHRPKFIDYSLRKLYQTIAQILSDHILLKSTTERLDYIYQIDTIEDRLFQQMTQNWDVVAGLIQFETTLLDLTECTGAAIYFDRELILQGETPTQAETLELITWLNQAVAQNIYATNNLGSVYAPAKLFLNKAAGILAISISKSLGEYVIWFRPEIIQTVTWNYPPPASAESPKNDTQLNWQRSFDKWQKMIKNLSRPWQESELMAAGRLRENIINIVIHNANEMRALNQKLGKANAELEAFSYSVSHDLRAPLRNIEHFTEILLEEYSERINNDGLEILESILQSAQYMNQLINDLLAYSRIGQADKNYNHFDLLPIINQAKDTLIKTEPERKITFDIRPLPQVYGDRPLIRQLVFNLLSNAIKYTRPIKDSHIEIGGQQTETEVTFYIKDNGVGFKDKYVDKIFDVFSRLHTQELFEGTGIGLAIAQRIVQSHQGRIWAESQINLGTTFFVSLPLNQTKKDNQEV